MAREVSLKFPDKLVEQRVDSGPDGSSNSVRITNLSPVFGGGAEPGISSEFPEVRASSVRGHLRFWWRATRGTKFDLPEMRQRESEIWGSTALPSPVSLDIVVHSCSRPEPCVKWDDAMSWQASFDRYRGSLPYVLFPFQGTSPDKKDAVAPAKFINHMDFTVSVGLPSQQRRLSLKDHYNKLREEKKLSPLKEEIDFRADVECAFWAWINFGGIGARTRRGCGALRCTGWDFPSKTPLPGSMNEYPEWYREMASYFGVDIPASNSPRPWPTAFRDAALGPKEYNDGIDAWSDVISIYKKFRQGVTTDANKHRYRSPRWPEAESVKGLVREDRGATATAGLVQANRCNLSAPAFPRVSFGLPIIMELRNERIAGEDKDVKPTLQISESVDRMASPLILKPLALSSGKVLPAIFVLLTPPMKAAYVAPGAHDLSVGVPLLADNIWRDDMFDYPNSPMELVPVEEREHVTSAVDAFFEYAISKK